jgi:hypothetical protein
MVDQRVASVVISVPLVVQARAMVAEIRVVVVPWNIPSSELALLFCGEA